MAPASSRIILPDLLSISTPFHDATNPFWKRATAEARRWVTDYAVLADHHDHTFFFQCQNFVRMNSWFLTAIHILATMSFPKIGRHLYAGSAGPHLVRRVEDLPV